MKYALFIYDDMETWSNLPLEEQTKLREQEMPRWIAFMGELEKADPSADGYELDSKDKAKVIRVRDGERLVTDGPFAETKEAVGGFFVSELPDLDEAIRLASLIPAAEGTGTIEIRPIVS